VFLRWDASYCEMETACTAPKSREVSVVVIAVWPSETDRAAPPFLPGLDTLPSADAAPAVLNHQRVDPAAAAV